jgi:hypothetical protein
MLGKHMNLYITLLLLFVSPAFAESIQMKPFTIDWRQNSDSLVNLSFLLDAPAGKEGFIRIRNGHLAKPNGERFRIWGINFTAHRAFRQKKTPLQWQNIWPVLV